MAKPKYFFIGTLALALLFAFVPAGRSQDSQNQSEVQSSTPSSDTDATSEVKVEAPAATPAHHHAVKKKTKKSHHHKSKKKKKTHKAKKKHKARTASKKKHAAKATKKKHAAVHHKKPAKRHSVSRVRHKKEAAKERSKEVRQQRLAPAAATAMPEADEPEKRSEAKKESETPEAVPAQSTAPKKKMASEHPDHRKAKTAETAENREPARISPKAAAGSKSVTYTFCLGYDNCTPYRYEAMVHGGTTDAKVFKENPDGSGWVETSIDPVMQSDLGAMARAESGNDIVRPLTVTEKARIADHQGKAHVELVAAANDGRIEQVKDMMKDLGIKNAEQLNNYDPRLAKNATALQAVSELSTGR